MKASNLTKGNLFRLKEEVIRPPENLTKIDNTTILSFEKVEGLYVVCYTYDEVESEIVYIGVNTEVEIVLEFDVFEEKYKPVLNKDTYLFETYGEDMVKVDEHDIHYLWTIVEGDSNLLYVVTGKHLVNRIGYIITNIPWENEEETYLY